MMKMKEPIKYFSMFSGIGGFEYGMEQSDYEFENVGFSEVDKYAISIYTRHFPRHRNYGDATKINPEELDDFTLLVGGFPCQAFSVAGKQKGFDDTRGTLFFEIARILRDKRPTYFLLENVKGLLSHDRGRTVQTIFRVCDELGYDVSWQIYNSKNYGVPQSRERLFIKGYFRERCESEILSFRRENSEYNGKVSNQYWGIRTGRIHFENELMNALTTSGKNCGNRRIICLYRPSQVNSVYSPEGLAPTLDTFGELKICEDYDDMFRLLTPVECERLQGFPDNWTKYGKDNEPISDTQRYKCCGNAVTTNVITAIINEMFKEVIEDEDD